MCGILASGAVPSYLIRLKSFQDTREAKRVDTYTSDVCPGA